MHPRMHVHTSLLSGLVNEKKPEYPPPNRAPDGRLTIIDTPADMKTLLKSTTCGEEVVEHSNK